MWCGCCWSTRPLRSSQGILLRIRKGASATLSSRPTVSGYLPCELMLAADDARQLVDFRLNRRLAELDCHQLMSKAVGRPLYLILSTMGGEPTDPFEELADRAGKLLKQADALLPKGGVEALAFASLSGPIDIAALHEVAPGVEKLAPLQALFSETAPRYLPEKLPDLQPEVSGTRSTTPRASWLVAPKARRILQTGSCS